MSWRTTPPPSLSVHLPGAVGLSRSKTDGVSHRRPRPLHTEPALTTSLWRRSADEANFTYDSPPKPEYPNKESSSSHGGSTRNSSFFEPSYTSPLASPSATSASSSPTQVSPLSFTQSSNPSLVAPLSPTPTLAPDSFEVRFYPTPDFRLGLGRFSKVYLGGYRSLAHSPSEQWELCAIKRMGADTESQELGLREAWFYRRLGATEGDDVADQHTHPGQRYIARLIGTQDEVSFVAGTHTPKSQRSISRLAINVRSPSGHESIPPVPHSPVLTPPSSASLSPTHLSSFLGKPHLSTLILSYEPLSLSQLIHTSPELITSRVHTSISYQLALAVSYIHSHEVLHADIKPHNVLLTRDLEVRLADFNTSLHLPSLPSYPVLPTDPIGLGTPAYSPAEFVRPPPSAFGLPADVFSLGVTLTVAILGREPFARLGDRGTGKLETMLWVGQGAYWDWEMREELGRSGSDVEVEARRSTPSSCASSVRETAQISYNINSRIGPEQISQLIDRGDSEEGAINGSAAPCVVAAAGRTFGHSRSSSLSSSASSVSSSYSASSTRSDAHTFYSDGSLALEYLGHGDGDGVERDGRGQVVPEEIAVLLRSMCRPRSEDRPLSSQVAAAFRSYACQWADSDNVP
ncbi:hypothetical protein BOTBODRAFT_26692 [Botryobasidium botryosum FD-172 SS1]|uniref:Protein kinase domain-containing protein n=1 Tax=Botryobasidium botryosum (strain FD-172 SS1) TaxID=930990 RepID=A0A067NA54_BOTB1|nr:hypothetical protein BOTBODRAFT_26692 [Botryobasidium botryosum FD-172 SS1]